MVQSKSRFSGLETYLKKVYIDKNLRVPSLNQVKKPPTSSVLDGLGDSQTSLSRFKDSNNSSLETQLIYNGQFSGVNKSQPHMRTLKSNDKVMSEMIKSEIHQSERTVEKIKRGFSLFELDAIRKAQTQSNERMVIN